MNDLIEALIENKIASDRADAIDIIERLKQENQDAKNMQLQHKYMTVDVDIYLEYHGYTIIVDDDKYKLVQLKNLKQVQIELRSDNSYVIQEVTQGKVGETWEDIGAETVIECIQMLEGE